MKKEIELTSEQEKEVIGLYEDMNKEAIELGNRFIVYEKELNRRFAERNIDEKIFNPFTCHLLLRYTIFLVFLSVEVLSLHPSKPCDAGTVFQFPDHQKLFSSVSGILFQPPIVQ